MISSHPRPCAPGVDATVSNGVQSPVRRRRHRSVVPRPARLTAELTAAVREALGSRVVGLSVEFRNDAADPAGTLVVAGGVPSYHAKQLATSVIQQHLRAKRGVGLRNELRVG